MSYDVSEQDFTERVIERSHEVPVVVDFWADWCGPCRQLTPALEKAAKARAGRIELAKVDVDANQQLAAAFRVQGIPAVKAFRDGRVAAEFTGAIPPAQVEAFFDQLVPSEAELAARAALASGDEDALRSALEQDPRNAELATALARILLQRGEFDDALALVEPFETDFTASGLAARIRLLAADEGLREAFDAWDAGDYEDALERLQEAFASADDSQVRDDLRKVMVAIFTELGSDSDLAREHRRRLSQALY